MAREPHLKGLGLCIFCGAPGLTKEHMYADWLKAYIPRTMREHHAQSTFVHLDKEDAQLRRRTGDPHTRRIKCVCGPCNYGWMSDLQQDAKPFLVPMLKGEACRLHRRAQTTVAAWVAMTVMVAENIDREMVAIPQADRTSLRENRTAPRHWRIWLGRHHREKHALFTHRVLPFVPEEEYERLGRPTGAHAVGVNTQTSTICFGEHLLVHVMSSTVAWSIIRRWKLPMQVSGGMAQIWPARAPIVAWPPGGTLTDTRIKLLADEFFDKATALLKSRMPRAS
jgi:hypothetical protein